MEKESFISFHSPINQKNTPIKRLGLSRKRKSNDFECKFGSKIQARSENFAVGPDHSDKNLSKEEIFTPIKNDDNATTDAEINYEEEIYLLKGRIAEKEEKLKAFQSMKNNIKQLEELIEVWKNGCKSAFLHFSELLKERQIENINFKTILKQLGIWEVMVENFGNDHDIFLEDETS